MPDPASSRSLEDILASIRKSLAEESVEGLVELSAAAVDAARAEHAGTPVPSPQEPVSDAEALADDLLRDKLAGALVVDTDAGEAEAAEPDHAASVTALSRQATHDDAPVMDSAALAKLWVLRPGIEKATPIDASAQPLTIDPFADVTIGEHAPSADFSLSPLELLGEAKALTKPLPSMPPLPAAGMRDAPASAPPRLDADSVALLQKLRASNAAAIENIAKSIEEVEAESIAQPADPEVAAEEATSATSVAAEPEDLAEPPVMSAPLLSDTPAEPEVARAQEEERPILSRPERSTPLFGAHEDARPPVTSGLDDLLGERPSAPLQVEDVASAAIAEAETAAEPEIVLADVVVPVEPQPVAEEPELAAAHEPSAEPVPATEEVMATLTEPDVGATASEEVPPVEAADMAPAAGNKALEDMIAAVLEPVLQRLIETSIGPALEVLVRREVERALKEQRPSE